MILEKTIDLLTDIRDDAQQQEEAKPGIESYCNHIHFVLQRYGNDAEIDKVIISNAYWLDLALVCLMFRLVKYRWEKQVTNIDFVFWKDRFEDNLYKWYEPSSQLLSRIREWVSSYSTDEQALQTFVLTAEKASSLKEMRGSLGEFYTPLPVANHLAKNLVKSDWSGNPIKIVDPAVGIGSLLGAVTSILIKEALANKVNASQIMCQLNRGLYGFDVQPAAVLLARLRLTLEILSVLSQLDGGIPQPLFPNLSLLDPLVEPETYWETTGQFCSVIANPPFARLNRNKVSFLEKYEDVLYGHANFYHLFVWWAVQATKPGGKIVFLLPQSFRSGLYGHRLRKHLADKCDLEGITMFTNRTGVFDDVNSPLMIVNLRKHLPEIQQNPNQIINICLSSGRDTLTEAKTLRVACKKVLRSYGTGPIWFISDCMTDYDLLDIIYDKAILFSDLNNRIHVGNGGFVWNQNKEMLRAEESDSTVPLISAVCVQPFVFHFPDSGMVKKGRQYALVADEVKEPLHSGHLLLVKRTTPKKRGRRIAAAVIESGFVERHPKFYIENHLNVISVFREEDVDLLKGLAGWLNSRLLNFIFQMMNGTSHISVSELKLLPLPTLEFLSQLAVMVENLSQASDDKRLVLQAELEQCIYDLYALGEEERHRINQWIP